MTTIERTLFIANKPCNKKNIQKGGIANPTGVIQRLATLTNPYLYFENCKKSFMFDRTINTKKDINGSEYLGKGAFTAVFGILDENGKSYILRIEETKTHTDLNQFILQWKNDKTKFPKNIIDIFSYGTAIVNGVIVGTYTITKKYGDYNNLFKLNFYQKNKFVYNMLTFLNELKQKNIYYRDFKYDNIGYDNDVDLNFIVLDYDNITLMDKNDSNFNNRCSVIYTLPINNGKYTIANLNHSINVCSGTYDVLVEKYDYYPEFRDTEFNKYYCSGLAIILLVLYFKHTPELHEFINIIFKQTKYYYDFEKYYIANNTSIEEPTVMYNKKDDSMMSFLNDLIGDINNGNNNANNQLELSNISNISKNPDSNNNMNISDTMPMNSIQNLNNQPYPNYQTSLKSNEIAKKYISPMMKDLYPSSTNSHLIGGGLNFNLLHEKYMEEINKNLINLPLNFNKTDCEIINKYYNKNFYDKLTNFIGSIIVNMMNPDANKIHTEKEILIMFNNVFLSTLPDFMNIS